VGANTATAPGPQEYEHDGPGNDSDSESSRLGDQLIISDEPADGRCPLSSDDLTPMDDKRGADTTRPMVPDPEAVQCEESVVHSAVAVVAYATPNTAGIAGDISNSPNTATEAPDGHMHPYQCE
jgi:hypothetical protein